MEKSEEGGAMEFDSKSSQGCDDINYWSETEANQTNVEMKTAYLSEEEDEQSKRKRTRLGSPSDNEVVPTTNNIVAFISKDMKKLEESYTDYLSTNAIAFSISANEDGAAIAKRLNEKFKQLNYNYILSRSQLLIALYAVETLDQDQKDNILIEKLEEFQHCLESAKEAVKNNDKNKWKESIFPEVLDHFANEIELEILQGAYLVKQFQGHLSHLICALEEVGDADSKKGDKIHLDSFETIPLSVRQHLFQYCKVNFSPEPIPSLDDLRKIFSKHHIQKDGGKLYKLTNNFCQKWTNSNITETRNHLAYRVVSCVKAVLEELHTSIFNIILDSNQSLEDVNQTITTLVERSIYDNFKVAFYVVYGGMCITALKGSNCLSETDQKSMNVRKNDMQKATVPNLKNSFCKVVAYFLTDGFQHISFFGGISWKSLSSSGKPSTPSSRRHTKKAFSFEEKVSELLKNEWSCGDWARGGGVVKKKSNVKKSSEKESIKSLPEEPSKSPEEEGENLRNFMNKFAEKIEHQIVTDRIINEESSTQNLYNSVTTLHEVDVSTDGCGVNMVHEISYVLENIALTKTQHYHESSNDNQDGLYPVPCIKELLKCTCIKLESQKNNSISRKETEGKILDELMNETSKFSLLISYADEKREPPKVGALLQFCIQLTMLCFLDENARYNLLDKDKYRRLFDFEKEYGEKQDWMQNKEEDNNLKVYEVNFCLRKVLHEIFRYLIERFQDIQLMQNDQYLQLIYLRNIIKNWVTELADNWDKLELSNIETSFDIDSLDGLKGKSITSIFMHQVLQSFFPSTCCLSCIKVRSSSDNNMGTNTNSDFYCTNSKSMLEWKSIIPSSQLILLKLSTGNTTDERLCESIHIDLMQYDHDWSSEMLSLFADKKMKTYRHLKPHISTILNLLENIHGINDDSLYNFIDKRKIPQFCNKLRALPEVGKRLNHYIKFALEFFTKPSGPASLASASASASEAEKEKNVVDDDVAASKPSGPASSASASASASASEAEKEKNVVDDDVAASKPSGPASSASASEAEKEKNVVDDDVAASKPSGPASSASASASASEAEKEKNVVDDDVAASKPSGPASSASASASASASEAEKEKNVVDDDVAASKPSGPASSASASASASEAEKSKSAKKEYIFKFKNKLLSRSKILEVLELYFQHADSNETNDEDSVVGEDKNQEVIDLT